MELAIAIALIMTVRKGTWIFKLKEAKGSTISRFPYIIAHGSVIWMTFAILFIAAAIGFVFKNLTNSNGILVIDLVYWESLIWMILFWTGFWATYPVATSYIIQRVNSDRPLNQIAKFFLSSAFVNIFAFTFLITYTVSVLPFAIASSYHYKTAIGYYLQIDQQLQIGEELVNGGGAFSILSLQAGAGLEVNLLSEFALFALNFGRYFYVTAGFLMILILVSSSFLFIQILSLSLTIDFVLNLLAFNHFYLFKFNFTSTSDCIIQTYKSIGFCKESLF